MALPLPWIAVGMAASHPKSPLDPTGTGPIALSRRKSLLSKGPLLWALLSVRSQGTYVVRIVSSSTTPLFKTPPLAASESLHNPSGKSFSLRIIALAMRQGSTQNCVPGNPCLRRSLNPSPCRVGGEVLLWYRKQVCGCSAWVAWNLVGQFLT